MRAFKFVIPIMLIVGTFGWIMLDNNFQEVPEKTRVVITLGAVLASGFISFFLFPKNEGEKY